MKMKKGFTIIETLLAMTFIGLLLVAIAILVQNVSQTYIRGVTLRNVNETARGIIEDLNRSITASPTFGTMDVHATGYDEGAVGEAPDRCFTFDSALVSPSNPQGCVYNFNATLYLNYRFGRFCTGLVSYIWNIHENAPRRGDTSVNGFEGDWWNEWSGSAHRDNRVRLVRVRDHRRDYCRVHPVGHPQAGRPVLTSVLDAHEPIELITGGEGDLWLYDFIVFRTQQDRNVNRVTGQVFYSGSFVLGTGHGVRLDSMNPQCYAPGEEMDQNMRDFYCSVNKFNFSQRALGSSQ